MRNLALALLLASPAAAQHVEGEGPPAPAPFFPFEDMRVLNENLEFVWGSTEAPKEVARFEFEIASDREFRKPAFTTRLLADGRPSGIYKLTPPKESYENLKRYFWRVRAQDARGRWGGWSEARRFDTFFRPPAIFPVQALPGPRESFRRPLSLSYTFEPYTKSVSGDRSRSFSARGVFSLHKLGLGFEQEWQGVSFQSNADFQHSNDPQIVQDKGRTQFLSGVFTAKKPDRFEAALGDTSGDLSRTVFNTGMRGFNGHYQFQHKEDYTRLYASGGQVLEGTEGQQFQRLAGGLKLLHHRKVRGTGVESGVSYARGEDRLASISQRAGVARYRGTAFGLNLKLDRGAQGLEFDAARSYGEERDGKGEFNGTAVRVSPRARIKNASLTTSLERNSAKFFNPLAGGPADTLRADASLSSPLPFGNASASYGFNRNNVDRTLTNTTKNYNYGLNLTLNPFQKRGGRLAGASLALGATRSDSAVTGGAMRTRNYGLSAGPSLRVGGLSLGLNSGWTLFRDYANRGGDRRTWTAGSSLSRGFEPLKGLSLNPSLSSSWNEGQSLATAAKNSNKSLTGNLNATWGKNTLSGSLSHSWLNDGATGRRTEQNSLQLSFSQDLGPAVPGSLNFSVSRRLMLDNGQPATSEIEFRGGLTLKI